MLLRKLVLLVMILFSSNHLMSQDQFINALSLDGNRNYVEVPHNDILNLGKAYTIEFWINTNNDAPAIAINKWAVDWNNGHQGWMIDINQIVPFEQTDIFDRDPEPGMLLFTNAHSSLTGGRSEKSSGCGGLYNVIVPSSWIHIALTINNTLKMRKMYVNGKGDGGGWRNSLEDDYNTPGYPLNIGGLPGIARNLYLNGFVDEVRIWNCERSASQIKSTMNDTLSAEYYQTPDSSLILYFRFDQLENLGLGEDDLVDDIRDFSFYKNHGDIKGNAQLVVSTRNTDVDSRNAILPMAYDLSQNYPNPFNPMTTIRFTIPRTANVKLAIYDVLGNNVATLLDAPIEAGQHRVQFDAGDFPAGIYFYQLQTAEYVETKKMMLVK